MKKFKQWTLLMFIVLFFVAILVVIFMWNHMSAENKKSTAEVYKNIEAMYRGEIVSFENNGDEYVMELSKNSANYQIEVRAKDGKILQMKKEVLDGLKKEDILSKKEVHQIIKRNYDGEIVSELLNTWQNKTVYQVQVIEQDKKVNIMIDPITGDILSETRINPNTNNTAISKKKAQQIAKQKLDGDIQKTTYFETSSGGYYLIIIKAKGQTKTFQIHAVSGDIMSITND